MTNYSCSKCGLAVAFINDEFIKACSCDAPVNANISAEAHGTGGLTN